MTYYRETTFRAVYRCFLIFEREAFSDVLESHPLYLKHTHVYVYGCTDRHGELSVQVLGFCNITDEGRMNVSRLKSDEYVFKKMRDLEDHPFSLFDGKRMGLEDAYRDLIAGHDRLVPKQLAAIRELNALDEVRDRYFIDNVTVIVERGRIPVKLEGIKNHCFTGRALVAAYNIRPGDEIIISLKMYQDHFYCYGSTAAQAMDLTPAEEAIARYRQTHQKKDGRAAIDVLVGSDVFVPLNLHDVDEETRNKLEKELESGETERFRAMPVFTNAAMSGQKNAWFPVFTSASRLKKCMPKAAALRRPMSEIILALMENEGTSGIAVNPDEAPVFLIPSQIFPYLRIKKNGDEHPAPEKMN